MSELKNWFKKRTVSARMILRFLFVCFLIILAITGIKGWRIYQKGMTVYEDAIALRTMARTPVGEMDFATLTSAMIHLQGDFDDFTMEVKPVLWLASRLSWVPLYGRDLAAAPDLIELAGNLVNASIITLDAGGLLFDAINSPNSGLDPAGLTELLVDAQPKLLEARGEFDQVLAARSLIPVGELSPRLRGILEEVDPLLELMDDGLSLSTTLPAVLGADGHGPKSYLLLVQNEDELRPTGGFITTVGKLVIQDGEIVTLEFESVDNGADWSKPYPVAPWQLQEYMNARVLILRDSNWSADFPINAMWAKYLYFYDHPEPMDGVIAFDQQFLVMLLGILGPLEVEGVSYPITSNNVIGYMRVAKEPPAGSELAPVDWYRKEFIEGLSDALLSQIIGGNNNKWRGLITTLIRAMDERHLLLQFDDLQVNSWLARHDWDGAVSIGEGDFLMTTDSNIGFNKTNALMKISLTYDVDLTNLSAPKSILIVTHENPSNVDIQCTLHGTGDLPRDYLYPMERCYWTYTRVYKQAGASLVGASPHAIPGEWMLLGESVPARVDMLDEEIENVQGFGTLLVVPGGKTLSTSFEFILPASVISREDGSDQYTYRLKVQKQPGRLANPLVIRVHLPNRAQVEVVNTPALIQGENLLVETDLRTDVYLEAVFFVP